MKRRRLSDAYHHHYKKKIIFLIFGTVKIKNPRAVGKNRRILDRNLVVSTDRNSTSGYVFMLVEGPISWSSKKQSAIALSSTEAEYRGVVNAATQCLWLQGLLGECGFEPSTVITRVLNYHLL